MLIKLIQIITGRPMKFISYALTDHVSGETVNYYSDHNGKVYLASSPWALFRVKL